MRPKSNGLIKPYLWLFLLAGILVACANNNEANEVDSLHDQVMKIHDEVMPKLSTISNAQLIIKKYIEDNQLDSLQNPKLFQQLRSLASAEEGMWSWMNQYSKPNPDQAQSESISYLNSQQKIIQKVSEDMLQAIENFKTIKKEYEGL